MKNFIVFFLFLSTFMNVISAQESDSLKKDSSFVATKKLETTSTIYSTYDRIFLNSGDSMVVTIKDRTVDEIAYVYPFNSSINKIKIIHVRQIIFSNGKTEKMITVFDSKKSNPNNTTDIKIYWQKVIVHNNTDSINGMLLKGIVKTVYRAEKLKEEDASLEKSGMIVLKKKVINMDGDCLLITNKRVYREFGEFPYIEIEGMAYKIQ